MKADDTVHHILDNYEDELICPICTDLLVAAHVGNPCGHSVCGDCGWQWYLNKAASRCCPCCRGLLNPTLPMIPNISMNNTVEKHVKALGLSGRQGWEPGGSRHRDWMARKQAWRDGEKQRERMKKMQQVNKPLFSLGVVEVVDAPENWLYVHDEAQEDPTYEDSDIEEIVAQPIQRPHRRRQRGGR
ncbi:hypothetical protein HYPSUDRAFT_344772 [Hypholoma sublateritium FD-334 SS-4]|uniref:RING-type domain-containing protein n=1 Tax=Hypholoma sublateritium (strain FD-334 SS-4) TaxID=945553 RepID=A0A0D2PBN8_HYPSF|nr:hypothetical protein HYPSUDRAFT_344772 [Hypholoma sublateritium FD-334 SS-4]